MDLWMFGLVFSDFGNRFHGRGEQAFVERGVDVDHVGELADVVFEAYEHHHLMQQRG